VQRGGAPRPDPLFGRSRPSWESVGRALWKRIRVEALCGRSRPHLGARSETRCGSAPRVDALCGRSRPHLGARSETRCGSAPRVEALLGRPAPALEGLDRKDRGERHPPGAVAHRIEADRVPTAMPAGIPRRWQRRRVPWQRLFPNGQRIQHIVEDTRRGRRSDAVTAGLPEATCR
jgi:hypothetical protein